MGSLKKTCKYYLNGRIPGCERFGHAWAIPEDAVKPDRLPPGAKAKHSTADKESGGKVTAPFKLFKYQLQYLAMASSAIFLIVSSLTCLWK